MNPIKAIYCRTVQAVLRAALPVLPYREPQVFHSCGELSTVFQKENIRRVLIVTDAGIVRSGIAAQLEAVLDEDDISYAVYDQTRPNPTVVNVEQALSLYRRYRCQALIAIGGGSSMDCAKAVGARLARPGTPLGKLKGTLRILRPLPTLIAIPTTAGTGSETTLAAVITDTPAQHKYVMNDFVLIPKYAVLDARLTLSLPPHLTATTGMDALTHAVEAYIGGSTTKETRKMAEEAVTLIHQHLKNAYDDGHNKEARKGMLKAAYCAGVAFTKSYVGYVHAVAHSLGGQYGVPHGLANAVILPYFLDAYGSACHKKLGRLARIAGVAPQSADDRDASEAFIRWIREMNAAMGIPDHIQEIRMADIPEMAHHAAQESNPLYPVPVLMDERELAAMYLKLMPRKEQNA